VLVKPLRFTGNNLTAKKNLLTGKIIVKFIQMVGGVFKWNMKAMR
jgi:hypothetical protein